MICVHVYLLPHPCDCHCPHAHQHLLWLLPARMMAGGEEASLCALRATSDPRLPVTQHLLILGDSGARTLWVTLQLLFCLYSLMCLLPGGDLAWTPVSWNEAVSCVSLESPVFSVPAALDLNVWPSCSSSSGFWDPSADCGIGKTENTPLKLSKIVCFSDCSLVLENISMFILRAFYFVRSWH